MDRESTLLPVHVYEVFFVLANVIDEFSVRHEIEGHGNGPALRVVFRVVEGEFDCEVAEVGAAVTFHDAEVFGVREPFSVKIGLGVEAGAFHDEGGHFPMRDGVSEPGGVGVNGKFSAVREDLAEDIKFFKQHHDDGGSLNDFDGERQHVIRDAIGKTAFGGIGRIPVRSDLFEVPLSFGEHGDFRSGRHEAGNAAA